MISMRMLAVAGVLSSAFAMPAMAATLPCEGCGYAQMQARAVTAGRGDHIIYSFSTDQVRKFSVICQGSAPLGSASGSISSGDAGARDRGDDGSSPMAACPLGRPLLANEIPLTGAEVHAWNLAEDFYTKNGGRVDRVDLRRDTGDLPYGRYSESVYTILSDYQARTDLYDVIFNNQSILDYAAALAASVIAAVGFLPNRLLVSVTFEDGTSIVLRYDADLRNFTLVPNSARLANGQALIEANSREYQGNYSTGGVDIAEYVNYLVSMGVVVTEDGTNGRLICSWDGHVLRCRVSRIPR